MLKTVITLGPASSKENVIVSLLSIADRFRLNTSHLDEISLEDWLSKLSSIFEKNQSTIPVVIDLQGSKMRIGQYPTVKSLPKELSLIFAKTSDNIENIPVPHEVFFKTLKQGDTVSLNDAKILIKIKEVTKNKAKAITLQNGPLSSNKGINRQKHPVPFEGLTRKDQKIIEISQKYSFTEYAFSFTHDGNEIDKLKPYTGDRRVIAKIERPEAIDNIKLIDHNFDELWLCRGDLGAQAGLFDLGRIQESFTSKMPSFKCTSFLAGQVLEHMTHFPEPTRSEIVHLYDIEKSGFEGIVLSDETAIGKNIEQIVNLLKNYQR